jgi:hypothetical protein
MGRSGEDGVALMSRRWEGCREGAASSMKLLGAASFLSGFAWLKLLYVSHLDL